MDMKLTGRLCPTCHERSEKELCASTFAPEELDHFAFASRKLPEYMHHRMVVCQICDLLYADPAPAAEVLAQLYRDAAFDSREEARWAGKAYARNLPEIAARLPDRSGALDVGTGSGDFLEHLIEGGFTGVRGVEPSGEPIAAAAPAIRRLIAQEVFDVTHFEPASLSLVSCFQTLEHLPDPAKFCAAAKTILKPGGALFVVVHNRKALSARVLGQRSPIFDIEHLQLFCRKSVTKMLKDSGFAEVQTRVLWNTYPLYYWARLFPFPRVLKQIIAGFFALPAIRNLRLALPAGNLAVVAYK